jgi:hypothetical protein
MPTGIARRVPQFSKNPLFSPNANKHGSLANARRSLEKSPAGKK